MIDQDIINEMKKDGIDTDDQMARLMWMKSQKEQSDRMLMQLRVCVDDIEIQTETPESFDAAVKMVVSKLPDTPAEAIVKLVRDIVKVQLQVTVLQARVALLERRPERVLGVIGITKEMFEKELNKMKEDDDDGKES